MNKRQIDRIYTTSEEQGFLGVGHIARSVVKGGFHETDPFIFLMDDQLDKKDREPVGGPHPHAGFETVSLMLDGEIKEMLESMKKGDFQVMTAGSGIVHTETIHEPVKGRLLQMWLNLPDKDRWVQPRLQILNADRVPTIQKQGVSVRIYSGSFEKVASKIVNYTPLIAAEILLDPQITYAVQIPSEYRSFMYLIDGSLQVEDKKVMQDQVAWFDGPGEAGQSEIVFVSGEKGARFVFYAALPTHAGILSHGPFIANTNEEIMDLYRKYRAGEMTHISEASPQQKIIY